jgi:hypothetical protein
MFLLKKSTDFVYAILFYMWKKPTCSLLHMDTELYVQSHYAINGQVCKVLSFEC